MQVSIDVLTTAALSVCLFTGLLLICFGVRLFLRERRSRTRSIYDVEKQSLFDTDSRSSSPIPEIRLTFPDDAEKDASKQVIVELGESGGAFVRDIPALDGFKELDLDDLGGLREPERRQ